MAVINLGSIVADIKGSVGNQTYARNQGGNYVRARAGPAGLPSANQIEITDTMTALSQAWSGTLTEAQRKNWRQYANQFPDVNQWGKAILHNGYTRFIKTNFAYKRTFGTIISPDAPLAPPLPPTQITFTGSEATGNLTIALPPLPAPDAGTPVVLFLYAGQQQPPGVTFYLHPFAAIGTNGWMFGSWLWDPWVIAYPGGLTAANKLWLRVRMLHVWTGAISPASYAQAVIGA